MSKLWLGLSACLFTVCLGAPLTAFAIDNDGDGVHTPADCDDSNNTIFPGAPEIVADGVDQDCNGGDVCYQDSDNDGARTNTTVNSTDLDCIDAFEGVPSDPIDCNDGNASIFPGAAEVVGDSTDQDCNGSEVCYQDGDDDGARTAATVISADVDCTDAFEGMPADPIDCNDANASIRPGVMEITGDNVDQDCSGNENCYADADNDGYRHPSTVIGSMDADCNDAFEGLAGDPIDCNDASAAANAGVMENCTDTIDNDCDMTTDCLDSNCSSHPACLPTTTVTTSTSTTSTTLPAQVLDHIKCYKIKTTEKLKGMVDLDPGTNPPFALEAGCKIGKAKKYCVPVMKTVTQLETTLVPNPSFVGQNLTDDRICYKVKCPVAVIPNIDVEDQFGQRTFQKFKATEICTPARQVP